MIRLRVVHDTDNTNSPSKSSPGAGTPHRYSAKKHNRVLHSFTIHNSGKTNGNLPGPIFDP